MANAKQLRSGSVAQLLSGNMGTKMVLTQWTLETTLR